MKNTLSVTAFLLLSILARGQQMSSINIQTQQMVNYTPPNSGNMQMAVYTGNQLTNVSQNPVNSFYMNENEETNMEQPITQVQTRNTSRNRRNTVRVNNSNINRNPVQMDNVDVNPDDRNDNVGMENNTNKIQQKREKLVYTPPPSLEYNLSNRIPQAKGTGNGSKQVHRSGLSKFFHKLGKNLHKTFSHKPRKHHRSRCPQWKGRV